MSIEEISAENLHELTLMALELWPDCEYEEELSRFGDILHSGEDACFLVREDERYVGFIRLSLRKDYVEGTGSSPVAYIEGLYVRPGFRNRGLASRLVAEGEAWGRAKGCTEYASDVELSNTESQVFHKKAGFEEANRIVCFVINGGFKGDILAWEKGQQMTNLLIH